MSNQQDLEQVELTIEQAHFSIDQMKAVQTLAKNTDFKAIIEEGYFKKEASRLVLLRADPAMQDEFSRKTIDDQITAIGYFRHYLTTINQLGRMAEGALSADEATRQELLEEGL